MDQDSGVLQSDLADMGSMTLTWAPSCLRTITTSQVLDF